MYGNSKIYILSALFAVLFVFYTLNILVLSDAKKSLVAEPARLSFLVVTADEGVCKECPDVTPFIERVGALPEVEVKKITRIPISTIRGKFAASRYDLKYLPSVVVSGDVSHEAVRRVWEAIEAKTKDGRVLIDTFLPRVDILKGRTDGVVDVVVLTDGSCVECVGGDTLKEMFKRSGVFVGSMSSYDISTAEGKRYVKKYGITKIPALVISPELARYPGIVSEWRRVGTVEDDGWFVFRNIEVTGSRFKNI